MPKLNEKQIAKVKAIAAKDREKADNGVIGQAFADPTDKKVVKAAMKECQRTFTSLGKILTVLEPTKEAKA
jgi:hypothetical protein